MNPSVADQGKAVATVTADDVAHAAHEVYEALLTAGPRSPRSMPPGVLAEPTVPEPMAGLGLGRLWDTHPKVAFVLHLLVTVYLGALAVWLFVTGATGGGVVLTIGVAVMAGSLVLFTFASSTPTRAG